VQALKIEFDRRGIAIIVISFARPERLLRYQSHHRWPFTILADPDRIGYHAFNLRRLSWWRVFSPRTLALYAKLIREGNRRRDYGKEDLQQAGGDFLIDRAGNILFAHRSRDPSDRPTPEKLLEEVKKVKGKK
jgi:peroxiredoxin